MAPMGNREHACKLSRERARSEWSLNSLFEGQFDLAENNSLGPTKLIWKRAIQQCGRTKVVRLRNTFALPGPFACKIAAQF